MPKSIVKSMVKSLVKSLVKSMVKSMVKSCSIHGDTRISWDEGSKYFKWQIGNLIAERLVKKLSSDLIASVVLYLCH